MRLHIEIHEKLTNVGKEIRSDLAQKIEDCKVSIFLLVTVCIPPITKSPNSGGVVVKSFPVLCLWWSEEMLSDAIVSKKDICQVLFGPHTTSPVSVVPNISSVKHFIKGTNVG